MDGEETVSDDYVGRSEELLEKTSDLKQKVNDKGKGSKQQKIDELRDLLGKMEEKLDEIEKDGLS